MLFLSIIGVVYLREPKVLTRRLVDSLCHFYKRNSRVWRFRHRVPYRRELFRLLRGYLLEDLLLSVQSKFFSFKEAASNIYMRDLSSITSYC